MRVWLGSSDACLLRTYAAFRAACPITSDAVARRAFKRLGPIRTCVHLAESDEEQLYDVPEAVYALLWALGACRPWRPGGVAQSCPYNPSFPITDPADIVESLFQVNPSRRGYGELKWWQNRNAGVVPIVNQWKNLLQRMYTVAQVWEDASVGSKAFDEARNNFIMLGKQTITAMTQVQAAVNRPVAGRQMFSAILIKAVNKAAKETESWIYGIGNKLTPESYTFAIEGPRHSPSTLPGPEPSQHEVYPRYPPRRSSSGRSFPVRRRRAVRSNSWSPGTPQTRPLVVRSLPGNRAAPNQGANPVPAVPVPREVDAALTEAQNGLIASITNIKARIEALKGQDANEQKRANSIGKDLEAELSALTIKKGQRDQLHRALSEENVDMNIAVNRVKLQELDKLQNSTIPDAENQIKQTRQAFEEQQKRLEVYKTDLLALEAEQSKFERALHLLKTKGSGVLPDEHTLHALTAVGLPAALERQLKLAEDNRKAAEHASKTDSANADYETARKKETAIDRDIAAAEEEVRVKKVEAAQERQKMLATPDDPALLHNSALADQAVKDAQQALKTQQEERAKNERNIERLQGIMKEHATRIETLGAAQRAIVAEQDRYLTPAMVPSR